MFLKCPETHIFLGAGKSFYFHLQADKQNKPQQFEIFPPTHSVERQM